MTRIVQARCGMVVSSTLLDPIPTVKSVASALLEIEGAELVSAARVSQPAGVLIEFDSTLEGPSQGGYYGSLAYAAEPAAPVIILASFLDRAELLVFNLPGDLSVPVQILQTEVAALSPENITDLRNDVDELQVNVEGLDESVTQLRIDVDELQENGGGGGADEGDIGEFVDHVRLTDGGRARVTEAEDFSYRFVE